MYKILLFDYRYFWISNCLLIRGSLVQVQQGEQPQKRVSANIHWNPFFICTGFAQEYFAPVQHGRMNLSALLHSRIISSLNIFPQSPLFIFGRWLGENIYSSLQCLDVEWHYLGHVPKETVCLRYFCLCGKKFHVN